MDKKNTNLSNEENELLALLNDSYSGEKNKEIIDLVADIIFQVAKQSLETIKNLHEEDFKASKVHFFAIYRLGDYLNDFDELIKLNNAFEFAKKFQLNESAVKYFDPLFNVSINHLYTTDSSFLKVICSNIEHKGKLFNALSIPGITYPELEFKVIEYPEITKALITAIEYLAINEDFDIQMAYSINLDSHYVDMRVNQEIGASTPYFSSTRYSDELYMGSENKFKFFKKKCSSIDNKITMNFKGTSSNLKNSSFSFTPCLQITIKK